MLYLLRKLYKECRNTDLIIGALEGVATTLAVLLGYIFKKPTISWVHTDISKYFTKGFSFKLIWYRYIYSRTSLNIVVSRESCKTFKGTMKVQAERCIEIGNPIPRDEIVEKSRDCSDVEEHFFLNPYIIAVGRLEYEKGMDTLVNSFSIIASQIPHKLYILGEGSEEENLTKLIEEKSLEKRVKIIPFQENPYFWMKKAEVMVIPSRIEGFGMAMLEAMSLAIPIVATECDGPIEILQEDIYGIIVPREDSASMAEAIMSIIKSEKKKMFYSSQALKRAKDFDVNEVANIFMNAFENVNNKGRR